MQTLTLHPYKHPDHPGLLYVMARIARVQAVNFRTLRFTDGTPQNLILAEAERLALERWPGEISYRLMLPVGDCGHALPSPLAPDEDAKAGGDRE